MNCLEPGPEPFEVLMIVVDVRADAQSAPPAGDDESPGPTQFDRRGGRVNAVALQYNDGRAVRFPRGDQYTVHPAEAASSRTASPRSAIRRETASSPHSWKSPTLAPNVNRPGMLNDPPSHRWAFGLSWSSTRGAL